MKRNRQSFLHGAAILGVSLAVVKVLGLVFKIPLTNILGGVGMGYYNTAFMFFSPVFSLAVGGIPSAASKMIAEQAALGRYRDVKRLFRLTLFCCVLLGIAGTGVMLSFAGFFVESIKNENALASVLAIAPTVFFGCVTAACRSYYEGLCDMRPTAVSQVVETVVKLAAGLGFAVLALCYAQNCYEAGRPVFGCLVTDPGGVFSAALPFVTAASLLGVSVSNLAGTGYLLLCCRKSDGISSAQYGAASAPQTSRHLFRSLAAASLPIWVGGFVLNITSMIDLFSMMDRLHFLVNEEAERLLDACAGVIPDDLSLNDVPNYLYGCYTGLAVSVFGIIPSVAGVFAKSALPNIASGWAGGGREETRRRIRTMLRVTALVTVPMGLGVSVLSGPILSVLFPSRPQEAAIAAPVLAVMGIGVIFQSGSLLIFSILQALGYASLPVRHTLAGGLVKICLNYLLVSDPSLHVTGAALSSTACYLLIFSLELFALTRIVGGEVFCAGDFGKPVLCGCVSAGAAYCTEQLSKTILGRGGSLLAAIAAAAAIYGILSLFCGAVAKSDLKTVRTGKKVGKVLEKMKLMR